MNFMNQKVLVVGGAGFIGSNLCDRILKDNPATLCIVDNLLSADISNVPSGSNVNFILGSISDDQILYKLPIDFDYIFHLSTYHGNQSSIANPLADHYNNTLTTLKICEYFKQATQLKKMIYAAAGCTIAKKTYDAPHATHEDAPASLYLDSPYQISKMVGELYGNYYFLSYKLPFVKARFQNVYGPREILGAGQWRGTAATVWRNVIPTFIWKSLHSEPLPLENEGKASRDFIYVSDLVEGLIACALKGKPGAVYNLASGEETSIRNLAGLICEMIGGRSVVQNVSSRTWDRSGRRFGDPIKAQQEIDFICKVSLKTGLQHTIDWTKLNYKLILNCISHHKRYVPEVELYSEKQQVPV